MLACWLEGSCSFRTELLGVLLINLSAAKSGVPKKKKKNYINKILKKAHNGAKKLDLSSKQRKHKQRASRKATSRATLDGAVVERSNRLG